MPSNILIQKINMKRIHSVIILFSVLLTFATSCKDRMSYSDYLKEERKAIELLIHRNNFSVLETFPKNGVFNENDFYKDPETGVYFNIIDYGDTTKNMCRFEL